MTEKDGANQESLRMGYSEVCKSYHAVRDAQLKLLALLPVIMGVGVSLLIHQKLAPLHYYVVGGLGASFTVGLYLYGARADEHASALIKHGALLETELKLPKGQGQFRDRTPPGFRGFLGYTPALILIYSALVVAWACVIYTGWRQR
jgi:hypothetical protein